MRQGTPTSPERLIRRLFRRRRARSKPFMAKKVTGSSPNSPPRDRLWFTRPISGVTAPTLPKRSRLIGGNAYVAGSTQSTDFPTANPLQIGLEGFSDAFLAKISPSGSSLVIPHTSGGQTPTSDRPLQWTLRGTLMWRDTPSRPISRRRTPIKVSRREAGTFL